MHPYMPEEDFAKSFLPFLPRRALKHWELRTPSSKSYPWAESTLGSLFASFFSSIRLRTPQNPEETFSRVVELKASVLLLDVSGFTRLSQLYGSRGTSGCEDFSLLISKFFHKVSVRATVFRLHLAEAHASSCCVRGSFVQLKDEYSNFAAVIDNPCIIIFLRRMSR